MDILKESYLVSEPGVREFNKEHFAKYDKLLADLDFEPAFVIDDKNLSKKEVISSYKTNAFTNGYLWDNLEYDYTSKITPSKKMPRKEIEKDIYAIRTDITKLCKQSDFDISALDDDIQMMLKNDLIKYTYEELLQVKIELEDLYWDMTCEGA